jgi:hypothetical protein
MEDRTLLSTFLVSNTDDSGSVQQVSQLLSLSGTTLDLAATLLTVSVVEFESGGSTSATGGSTGSR